MYSSFLSLDSFLFFSLAYRAFNCLLWLFLLRDNTGFFHYSLLNLCSKAFFSRATPEGSSGPYHSHYFIKLLAHFLFPSAMPLSIFAIFFCYDHSLLRTTLAHVPISCSLLITTCFLMSSSDYTSILYPCPLMHIVVFTSLILMHLVRL